MLHARATAVACVCLAALHQSAALAAPEVTIPLTGVSITNGSTAGRNSSPEMINAALRYRSRTDGMVVGTPTFSLLGLLISSPQPLSQALQTLTGSPPNLDSVFGNPAGTLPVVGMAQTYSGSGMVFTTPVTISATLAEGIDATGVASFTLSNVSISPTLVGGLKFTSGQVTLDAITCLCDLNFDGVVDDSDFTLFVVDYDALVVAAPQTGGDFNGDGVCDDADFSIFAGAYNELVCP
jgi:hypothetical protein